LALRTSISPSFFLIFSVASIPILSVVNAYKDFSSLSTILFKYGLVISSSRLVTSPAAFFSVINVSTF